MTPMPHCKAAICSGHQAGAVLPFQGMGRINTASRYCLQVIGMRSALRLCTMYEHFSLPAPLKTALKPAEQLLCISRGTKEGKHCLPHRRDWTPPSAGTGCRGRRASSAAQAAPAHQSSHAQHPCPGRTPALGLPCLLQPGEACSCGHPPRGTQPRPVQDAPVYALSISVMVCFHIICTYLESLEWLCSSRKLTLTQSSPRQ